MTEYDDKLRMNKQRRVREQLLEKIIGRPDELTSMIKEARPKDSKVLYDRMNYDPYPNFLTKSSEQIDHLWFTEYDAIHHVYDQLRKTIIDLKPPVLLYFGEGPVYHTDKYIGSAFLILMAKLLDEGAIKNIFVGDTHSGLIIDTRCDYLDYGRSTNDDEFVFEMIYYQTKAMSDIVNAIVKADDL